MPAARYPSKLIEKRPIAAGTMEFRLEKPAGLHYRAGQYFDIFLRKPAPDAEKSSYAHGFSFASAPCEPHIAAATRLRSGSAFKNALRALPDGSDLEIEAVWGDFTLRKDTSRPVVFLTGGIGVTPVRSMVAQATHDRTQHGLTLLFANRTPADAPYVDDFRQFARDNPNFTFVQAYTRTAADDPGAERGRITTDMIRRHVADVQAPVYYISGPRAMVAAMRDLLDGMQIDADDIRTEEFDGY